MDEEMTTPTIQTEETSTPTPTETPGVELSPAEDAPTWKSELDKADAKELRAHPKIAGIIGGEIQRAIQAENKRREAEAAATAKRQEEERYERLAAEDPYKFSEDWLNERKQQAQQSQAAQLQARTLQELAESIGRALQDVPEWRELTEADHQKLASQLMGKPETEIIPLFNRLALEIVADRRAKRLSQEWKEKELPKERAAIRDEQAAQLLKKGTAPDTTSPKRAPASVDINGMSDAEFDVYWKKRFGR